MNQKVLNLEEKRSMSTIVASKNSDTANINNNLGDLRDDIIEEEIESGANFGEIVSDKAARAIPQTDLQ